MAIIQKIRDKYAKVAGGVIVLSLVGFVLMDATSGGRSSGGLFGSGSTIAKVNGESIDFKEYEALVNAQEEQMRQQNRPMDENSSAQTRDQVFSQMVMQRLSDELIEKLGLTVTDAELKEMLNAANPDPMVRQAFTNPQTGEYSAEMAAGAIAEYERTKDPVMKANWENFKRELAQNKAQNKLNAFINGSYYTPKFLLDEQYEIDNSTASFEYVSLPYTLIPDDKVKVTDEDINKYIASKKALYFQKEESRSAEFVTFTIAPSAADSARVRTELENLREGLATAEDVEAYVKRNSATQFPVSYQTDDFLTQMQIEEMVKQTPSGNIVGPFQFGQDMAIAKVMNKASLPDTVKVRHILVMTKRMGPQGTETVRSEEEAQARIDSMLAKEKAGVPFDSLIAEYSDDNIAQNPSGEYELPLTQRSNFTKEFGDFAFSGAGAGASKVVKVESPGYSGLHYIQILNKGNNVNATQLAIIAKPIVADKNTYAELYAKASEFANKVTVAPQNFEKEANAAGLFIQPTQGINKNSRIIPGLGASSELVNWAYDAKVNDVSPIFTVGGNRIVIARLTGIQPVGLLQPTGNTKLGLETVVRNQKKAQMLIDATKDKKSLADIAAQYQVEVATAESVNGSAPMIPGIGNEPKLLGYVFGKQAKENALSPAIPTMGGVYYVQVSNRNMVKAPAEGRNLEAERQNAEISAKGRMAQLVLESMRQNAEIKDYRYKFNRTQ